ncbi:N-acetyltransferase [Streptomyces sp. BPTC-684]|uniref:N-acetyltransferase n=1 Tax=Streptomyces sp. BPTC-684 TaxID=3043734 RepID=UPI0024B19884|nr:N-acetyltransferase [Streptomyces sp. BPTC-684]WHM36809.1 N-acetyltransferase [Streptomyces sp. BPTC-684]
MTDLTITTLADRPELIERVYDIENTWPAFIDGDTVANALLHRVAADFPEFCVMATDQDGTPVARGLSIPFRFGVPQREELPDGGWDRVLTWAYNDKKAGLQVNTASALEIMIAPDRLGSGLSYRMLTAMREAVVKQGMETLVAPVRPNEKHLAPLSPMHEYIKLTRPDALPQDAWLRVHVRAGATIEKVAPASMVVAGSLAQWRTWTGLPFDKDGDVVVPGALVPVNCSVTHDRAVYVEPNVWVRHNLT